MGFYGSQDNGAWDFPGGPVVKTLLIPLQGARVQSLVKELRFCMPRGAAKKKKKKMCTAQLIK